MGIQSGLLPGHPRHICGRMGIRGYWIGYLMSCNKTYKYITSNMRSDQDLCWSIILGGPINGNPWATSNTFGLFLGGVWNRRAGCFSIVPASQELEQSESQIWDPTDLRLSNWMSFMMTSLRIPKTKLDKVLHYFYKSSDDGEFRAVIQTRTVLSVRVTHSGQD